LLPVPADGQMMLSAPQPLLLFPGSFNPVHEGTYRWHGSPKSSGSSLWHSKSRHKRRQAAAGGRDGEMPARAIRWKSPVELTRAPPSSKSRACFQGLPFIVTRNSRAAVCAEILCDDERDMHDALDEIASSEQLFCGRAHRRGGRVRAVERYRRPRRLCRSLHRNP